MTAIHDQPPPVPNDRPAIADLVIADMHGRKALGLQRYGVPLQAHNGRDALVDAYQEAIDLAMYLRQAIEERQQPDGLTSGEHRLNRCCTCGVMTGGIRDPRKTCEVHRGQ